MTDSVYNRAKNNITITDLRVLLLVGSIFDPDDDNLDDVIAGATKEADFTNYVRKALASEAFSVDDTSNLGKLDSDDPATWEDAGGTADNTLSAMVVYEHVDSDDTNNLPVSYHDTGFPKTTNGGDLTVQFSADGIFTTA